VLAALGAMCAASLPTRGEESAANLGMRRAAASEIEWELREANHPVLGQIRFTARKTPAITPIGNEKIVSQAYVSCQKANGRIAIELTNAFQSNLKGGLGPREMPRLTCYSTDLKDDSMGIREIPAKWATNELGDVLARGLVPADLRRCISIEVLQEVALPTGSGAPGQKIVLEMLPFDRSFDSVVVACGEKTAYASSKAPVAAPTPPAEPKPAAAPDAASWSKARTVAKGQTNVRAAPNLSSQVLRKLDPGTPLLVQHGTADWWRVKPASGPGFSGFIREDRLDIE